MAKISGRLYPEGWAKFAALVIFVGFNLTFSRSFSGLFRHAATLLRLPRRVQVLNVMSSAGASILGVGYLIPMIYFIWSMRYGPPASANPFGASGLEWQTASPPPTENFAVTPVVTGEVYTYPSEQDRVTNP